MTKLASDDLRRYAVLGAEQRLTALEQEQQQIYRTFPELRGRDGRRRARDLPVRSNAGQAARAQVRSGGRRRRRISAEGRKRISEAQKARWAKQKGQEPTQVTGGPKARKKK